MTEVPFYGAAEAQVAEFQESFFTLMNALEDADEKLMEDNVSEAYERFRNVITSTDLQFGFTARAEIEQPDLDLMPPPGLRMSVMTDDEFRHVVRRLKAAFVGVVVTAVCFGFLLRGLFP